jgi:hypothetical protein
MRYKELLSLLESEYDVEVGGASGVLRSAQSDFGTFRVENAAMITRINAFIHNYLKEACLDPKQTIFGLRQKLNQVGLDFDFSNKNAVTEGTMNLKLTRFGGIFGKSDTTPFDEFDNEDGLEKSIGHGLTLNLEMTIDAAGLYKLDGKVVPTISETSEEVEVEEAKHTANKDYDGDGKVESGTDEWKGSRDKAIKKAMATRKEEVEETDEGVMDTIKNKVDRIQQRRSGRGAKRIGDVQRAREKKNTTRGQDYYDKAMDKYDADKPENANKPEMKKSDKAHDVADTAGSRAVTGKRTKFGSKR